MTQEKRLRAALRATVEKVARELTLQMGRDESLWELMRDDASKMCLHRREEAAKWVRAYETRKRQGATAQ